MPAIPNTDHGQNRQNLHAFIVVSLVALVQIASCTQANPDWVYVTTITGTKSQDIDIDGLVPSEFHWGVRSTYTAIGDATFELSYNNRSPQIFSDGNQTYTYILDLDPDRNNTSYGQGPLRVIASPNVINYTLNIYYDANLVDETPSPSPSPSPPPTPAFDTYAVIAPIAAIAIALIIALMYVRAEERK